MMFNDFHDKGSDMARCSRTAEYPLTMAVRNTGKPITTAAAPAASAAATTG